jgi:carboxyl-terminal processing protease
MPAATIAKSGQDIPMRTLPARSAAVALAALLVVMAAAPLAAERSGIARAAEAESDWRTVDRAKLFDAVTEATEKHFFNEERLKQLDWRSRAAAIRPSVLDAPTPDDAVRRINALLAELNTSHTTLLTPDDYSYYILLDIVGAGSGSDLLARSYWGSGPFYPGIGAFTRQVDGRHFVDAVMEGSPAERAGIKFGDEILTVDGAPYTPVASFRGRIGERAQLTIRRAADAAPLSIWVDVIPVRPTAAFSAATRASARVIEHGGSRIGYVHVWASNEADSVEAALAKLAPGAGDADRRRRGGRTSQRDGESEEDRKPLDHLIIDMRGRVGGTSEVAGRMLELLDEGRKPYWGSSRIFGRERTTTRRQSASFRGRSALLIDHNTRSAGEIMALGYKRSGFGPVLGTPTAGAVSAGSTFVMPGDLLLYVAVAGLEFDGRPLEGAGVTPDRRVEQPLPYAAGADPVLDAALDLLARQVRH